MDCSNARQMISEYLDGEMSRQDSEEVRAHIACCADCACVFEALRSTTALIADADEIEPPAYLMEQILAATTERPTLREKLTGAFGRLVLTPAPVRWAAASAAVILVAMAALNNVPMMKSTGTPIAVKSPAPAQHAPIIAAQPSTEPAVVAPSQPVRTASVRRPTSHRRNSVTVAKANNHSASASTKPKVQSVTDQTAPIQEQPSADETSSQTEVAAAPVPVEDKEIKISKPVPTAAETAKRDVDALADLRTKLAARNKHRRYTVQVDPIQGHKVTIELASIKF